MIPAVSCLKGNLLGLSDKQTNKLNGTHFGFLDQPFAVKEKRNISKHTIKTMSGYFCGQVINSIAPVI